MTLLQNGLVVAKLKSYSKAGSFTSGAQAGTWFSRKLTYKTRTWFYTTPFTDKKFYTSAKKKPISFTILMLFPLYFLKEVLFCDVI